MQFKSLNYLLKNKIRYNLYLLLDEQKGMYLQKTKQKKERKKTYQTRKSSQNLLDM